jgi:ribosomal protein L37E
MITTGNFIVTTIGCFLLGLLLNRSPKKRPQETVPTKSPTPKSTRQILPAPTSSVSPTTGIRCGSCGSISKRRTKYCAKCGSNIEAATRSSNQTDQPRYTPQAITSSLSKVRGQNEAEYVDLVQNLLMIDEQEKYWSIGVNSSIWYVQGDGGWAPSRPQGTLQLTHRNIPIIQSRQMVTPTHTIDRKIAKICRFCGAEIDASDAFCLNCGKQASMQPRPTTTPPPARTRTCRRCGATVNAKKRFCTSCGTELAT